MPHRAAILLILAGSAETDLLRFVDKQAAYREAVHKLELLAELIDLLDKELNRPSPDNVLRLIDRRKRD